MDGGTDVRPLIVHHCIFITLRAGANSTVTLTDGVTDIPVLTYALGALNISTGTDWRPPQIVSGFSGLTLNTTHIHTPPRTEIPGNASPLIQKAQILGVSLFARTLDVVFFSHNPFDACTPSPPPPLRLETDMNGWMFIISSPRA